LAAAPLQLAAVVTAVEAAAFAVVFSAHKASQAVIVIVAVTLA
jgi:hypothetical protein